MNITIILPCNLNDKIVYSKNIILFILSDLSDCQLMQVPDAVYYMMRNTTLVSCNLSSNVITKIPPKFPAKFSLITGKKIYLNIVSTIKLNMIRVERNDFIDIALEYIYIPYTYFLYCV